MADTVGNHHQCLVYKAFIKCTIKGCLCCIVIAMPHLIRIDLFDIKEIEEINSLKPFF